MKYYKKNIHLHPKNKWYLNTLRFDNEDYVLDFLNPQKKGSKGANSNVYLIKSSSSDWEGVIKFSKFDILSINNFTQKRILRFSREIEALTACKNNGRDRIIDIEFNNTIEIDGRKFSYYVMEKAEYDLTTFLNKEDITIQQRFSLCLEILEGIKQLHSLRIYHRDIKPDNILYTANGWKIGDLGLVDFRESDFEIEEEGERVGPIGWLSPEAANKFLCEGVGRMNYNNHDLTLNEESDIFQLGKLFWYIFQGNIPIGQIVLEDFISGDQELFEILFKMLSYSKIGRYDMPTLVEEFERKSEDYFA